MREVRRELAKNLKIRLKEDVAMKKAISIMSAVLFAVLFIVSSLAFAAQKEKIAVAAEGQTLSASVGGQPARSPYFLFFDDKGKMIEAVTNPARDGRAAADFLASKGVTVVVAGAYGPIIGDVMKNKGMKIVTFKGTVEEAVKNILKSK
jgi:predicted Fe-Mo cluster-binding NifX family protein